MGNSKKPLTIYISGLYSGPNPSPGVGIARSLRMAYPDAVLIGVDYSNRSSGLHWVDFDEIWLQRPWDELDLREYASQIKQILDAGALWISGLDLETLWLAHALPEHPNLLVPPSRALVQVTKPAIPSHEGLPVKVPSFTSTLVPESALYAFCRKHGWPVWVKGPWYESRLARNWPEVKAACSQLSETWGTDSLFVQEHIVGYEESVAFCAFGEELLDCVYMRKRDITPEGKTWAGYISEVPPDFLEPLLKIVKRLKWTGGAELECVRDIEGRMWLLEWNPRFPAWIHGSTIAGHNLPALLVEHATGIPASDIDSGSLSKEFTRVVLEIPVRSRYPLPPLPEPIAGQRALSLKHPSGMPILARRFYDSKELTTSIDAVSAIPVHELLDWNEGDLFLRRAILDDLARIDLRKLDTPCWLFFESTARFLFQKVARTIQLPSSSSVKLRIAYSVKTNPDNRFLELARVSGFLAEAISQLEIEKCLSEGFAPEQIVLNGPGKWWPNGALRVHPIYALFCDSIEELKRTIDLVNSGMTLTHIIGVRIRPPQIASRFGIPVSSFDVFQQLVRLAKTLPPAYGFGIHFHIPSSEVGLKSWRALFESVIKWGKAIEIASGRRVQCLDIGGGFFPGDLRDELQSRFENMVRRATQVLPSLYEIILEPGKALAQPGVGLAVRVLEIRRSRSQVTEVVVDGSVAELPEIWHYPHPVLWLGPDGEWQMLKRGKSSLLLGRLCMESDIFATDVEIPNDMKEGDILIFCDAGAYDRSMSYAFGRG